jgi:hypothetical protein
MIKRMHSGLGSGTEFVINYTRQWHGRRWSVRQIVAWCVLSPSADAAVLRTHDARDQAHFFLNPPPQVCFRRNVLLQAGRSNMTRGRNTILARSLALASVSTKKMARDISAWQLGWEFIHDGKKSSRSTRHKRIGRGICRRGRHGGHPHGERIKLGRTRQPAAGNYRNGGETRKLPSNDPNQHVRVQWLSVAVRGNLEHNRTGSPRCFLS